MPPRAPTSASAPVVIAKSDKTQSLSSSYDPSSLLRLSDQNSYTVYEFKTAPRAMSSVGSSSYTTSSSARDSSGYGSLGASGSKSSHYDELDPEPRDWAEEAYEAVMHTGYSRATPAADSRGNDTGFGTLDEGVVRPILISKESQGWIWNTDLFVPKWHQRSFQPIHIGMSKSPDPPCNQHKAKSGRGQPSHGINGSRPHGTADKGKKLARTHRSVDVSNAGHDQIVGADRKILDMSHSEDNDDVTSQDYDVQCHEIFISDD